MNPPTARQLEVLRAIADHHRRKGFPISIRELGTELNIRSTNSVSDHLKALIRKGLVQRERMRSRSLTITNAGRREIEHG